MRCYRRIRCSWPVKRAHAVVGWDAAAFRDELIREVPQPEQKSASSGFLPPQYSQTRIGMLQPLNATHQRVESAAEDSRFGKDVKGWLSSAAGCGSTYGPSNVGICSTGTYQGACSAQKMLACGRISGSESKSPLGTTQNFWFRLNFGTTDPQFRQKQRVNPGLSLASTNRPIRSSPRVHETESAGKPKFATWTDPDDF